MRVYLKELRENNEMTQQDVANVIKVTRQYYQKIESGGRQQRMEIAFAAKLADAFNVSIEHIIEKEREWSEASV